MAMSLKRSSDAGPVQTRQGPDARALRALLVEENPAHANRLLSALREAGCDVVATARLDDSLRHSVERTQPDMVVVQMESPRCSTLQSMQALARERPIIMFVDNSSGQTTQSAIRAGVAAYVVGELNPKRVRSVIDVAIARFEEYRALRQELEKTKATLSERKIIERAKGLLMKERNLAEDEAYSVLRKQAMAQNRRLVDVARALLTYADILKPGR